MKPTEQEKQWLQDYLYQSLSYRETYSEVYDHILLALEDRPAREFFASTVNDIIEEDFGGSINMLNMEVECTYTVKEDIISQYRNNINRWFKFPLIIYTTATFFSLYYLFGGKVFTCCCNIIGYWLFVTHHYVCRQRVYCRL